MSVSIVFVGPQCARRGCRFPEWKDGLCNRCWRLAHMFGHDPQMFAYEPLHGYDDDRDAVALPWERWEQEAGARGLAVADLLAEARGPDRGSQPPQR